MHNLSGFSIKKTLFISQNCGQLDLEFHVIGNGLKSIIVFPGFALFLRFEKTCPILAGMIK